MRRKLLNLAAMVLVGDGLVTSLHPRREARLWGAGPKFHRKLMSTFERRPQLARGAALLELAVGFWLASRTSA